MRFPRRRAGRGGGSRGQQLRWRFLGLAVSARRPTSTRTCSERRIVRLSRGWRAIYVIEKGAVEFVEVREVSHHDY